MEHIAPQAQRNLNVACVIMDNAVYGLTKGQSSPTAHPGLVTSSTPFGKVEESLDALMLYLTVGVSFVASGISTKIKDLSGMIYQAMEHPGFAVVHVQSPCTTYHNTFEQLKGNPRKGIEPMAWEIPDDHDPEDVGAARDLVGQGGVPLGVVFQDKSRMSFEARVSEMTAASKPKSAAELVDSYAF